MAMEHPKVSGNQPAGLAAPTPAPQEAPHPALLPTNLWVELTCLSVILMELCWIAPLYYLLARFPTGVDLPRSFAILGAILLAAYLQARLTSLLSLASLIRVGIYALAAALSLIIGIRMLVYFPETISLRETIVRYIAAFSHIDIWVPKEFGASLVILLLGLNGFSLATGVPDPLRVYQRFWISLCMLLVFGLLTQDNPDALPVSLLYLFLISGLVAMSAARLALLGRLRGGQRIHFDGNRVMDIGLFGVGMASLSLGASLLFRSRVIFTLMVAILTLFIRAVVFLFAILLLPVYVALIFLIPGIKLPAVMLPIFQFLANLIHQVQLLLSMREPISLYGLYRIILDLKPFLLWGLLLLSLFVILTTVHAWTLKKFSKETCGLPEMDQTTDSLAVLRPGLLRRFAFLAERLAHRLRMLPGERLHAAERIRRIYADLMGRCAGVGIPRPASCTPLEFLPLLACRFPHCMADLELITQVYIRIRYGELPEYPQQLDEVETAWSRVKEELLKTK
jgi:hypothetical protein